MKGETMAATKVTVWYDDTSEERGWVIDQVDEMGSSLTVNVLDDEDEAKAWAKQYAEKSGLPCEID